ncbi:WGR domain-containing protein [Marinitenerispora sediminis]|uniref:Molybdenum metabolism regulator n=1 Tax=Marinitenerispora sediminis TaxID=1931232 RepID=A0A368T2V7_9ACTN|nr:WGR domain-containing protein [Marinitenerispora sediminis]RCV48445.1 molybdenum metabolism regulator [Marinitenerispora sediminis]RCV52515.1 molybdenum metabolism regulator [Marinitenerispora sediminis]RCV56381.1 molybdenum metabolism regulator [Marinitenerispora sediminis]
MADDHTYLELSEEGGGAHKFYEVVRDGTRVTVTYGRIGERGQTKASDFATEQQARTVAAKKVREKTRKGYAPAVRGQRTRRPVTRRAIVSSRSTARQAPVLWRFASGAAAFGIFVDERRCWVGNQRGDVFTLTHGGSVTSRFRLPDGVKCIVADDFWIYAGCDDGKVYDLSGKVPRVAYEISADVDIYWLDIDDATLGVSDRNGRITTIDHEDEFQWARDVDGDSAWMVRCDGDAVYHGHSRGVAGYDAADGRPRWQTPVSGNVLFGWQEADAVYAGTGGGRVFRLNKRDGAVAAVYRCDAAVFSCATAPGGRYVFAGDNTSSVYCFDESGERLWKLGTGCGSAFSMQFLDDRLYIVTTDGTLACIDASEAAIRAAQEGSVPEPLDVKAAASLPVVEPTVALETTADAGDGVVVECYQDSGRLRVRVVTPGYDSTWHVQFPKGIRQPGARYLVEGVRPSGRGGFYRAHGDIKRLL